MAAPTQRKLTVARGTSTFHPSDISWSKRNRGRVQRTHTKNHMKKATLAANMSIDSSAPGQPPNGRSTQVWRFHSIDGSKTSVLHWHGDTFDLPDGATRLASTDLCLNQAFSWGEAALALQFHVETMGAALETWFVGHTAEIASHEGVSVASLRADNQHWTPILEPYARQFFREWMTRTGL